jgi:general secretion pathway protein E
VLSKPPVSYAFAKANGVAVTGLGEGAAEAIVRAGAPAGALAELRRALGVPIRAQQVSADAFDERIAALYNGMGEGAAALADDLAQDLDLSRLLQDIPRVEDLLDSQNDAPLFRLINALLTQALR